MKLFDVYPLFDITPIKAEGCYVWDSTGKIPRFIWWARCNINRPTAIRIILKKLQTSFPISDFIPIRYKILCSRNWPINWEKFQDVPITSFFCAIRARKPMKMQLNLRHL
jgi:hypothetical protein